MIWTPFLQFLFLILLLLWGRGVLGEDDISLPGDDESRSTQIETECHWGVDSNRESKQQVFADDSFTDDDSPRDQGI